MDIPKDLPAGHEPLCKCLHRRDQHLFQKGKCAGCECKRFDFQGMAQMTVENPLHQPRTEVPLLKPKEPKPKTRWQRSIVRKWLRDLVGVTEDMEAGTFFMQLTTQNLMHQAQLIQGLRTDVNAANDQQNPVNDVVIELERRIHFYESEVGTGLAMSYRKLMAIDEQKRAHDRKVELEQRNLRRKLAVESGEFIDCPTCGGAGAADDKLQPDTCPQCNGDGVVPNPEYKEPSEFTDEGVRRHLTLEG